MDQGLFIQMFGSAEFFVSGKPVTTRLSAKSLAILVFLICHEQRRVTREKLASMFWAESYDTATYNLRYNLWNIKKVIPPDENGAEFLITSKDFCGINPAYRYTSDLTRLEQLLEIHDEDAPADILLEINEILSREFLEDFYIRDSDEFNDWLLFERTRYQKLSQQNLEQLYDSYIKNQDIDRAEEALRALLRINPYEEKYYCRIMKLCLQKGERHAALRWYQSCEDLLRKDLNLAPSKTLRELYLEITSQEQELSPRGETLEELTLELSGNEDTAVISGLLLSEFIELLTCACERTVVNQIPKVFLEDLSSIQSALIPTHGLEGDCRQVSQARLLNSLRGLITQLSKTYCITVYLKQEAMADPFSRHALHYLQRTCPDVFRLYPQ